MVKKLGLGFMALAVCLSTAAFAEQKSSFTYNSTAGMFEDIYDYFEFSPAYLPSFQKNVFWGQLSNLASGNDQQVNNATYNNTSFLIGGQGDLLGLGRGGVMFDWTGATTSPNATNYNTYTSAGFSENTISVYRDTDGDGIIDYRADTYSRVQRVMNNSSNDLYVPYGLGGLFGMDFGLAVRGSWTNYSPTYAPMTLSYGSAGYSFNEVTQVRQYDLLSGATLYSFDRTGTGSLNYGYSDWRLLLGGRVKDLIPNLDLVVNVGPILRTNYNQLTAQQVEFTDYTPGAAVDSNLSTTTRITGEDPTLVYSPASGLGVQADVRGDYALSPSVILTGVVDFNAEPTTLASNAFNDNNTVTHQQQTVGSNLVQTNSNNDQIYNYSGTNNDTFLAAKLRAQFIAKKMKVGLGVNYSYHDSFQDETVKSQTNNLTQVSGTGDPAQDYIKTTTGSMESKSKYEGTSTIVEFPIGVVLELIDNLPFRFGAKHTVTYSANSSSVDTTSWTPTVTNTVYANGSSTSSVMGYANNTSEYSYSSYTITHATTYYYGASWWPLPYLQVDFTGFAANVWALNSYNLSCCFYF